MVVPDAAEHIPQRGSQAQGTSGPTELSSLWARSTGHVSATSPSLWAQGWVKPPDEAAQGHSAPLVLSGRWAVVLTSYRGPPEGWTSVQLQLLQWPLPGAAGEPRLWYSWRGSGEVSLLWLCACFNQGPAGVMYGCSRADWQEGGLPFPPREGAYPRASVFAVSL